ncbi:MAG TPA: HRDC domain-containing protein, partial [Acidimicrobiia bacterium]|nr:HRDC domain-containing protein [Acidimicrobiia bacterium]
LVTNTVQLEQVVRDFSGAEAYALDTEFHAEGTYYPRLALIQLAIPGQVAVIDATAVDPRRLEPLFAGPGVAVTHAGGPDIEIVDRACGARPSRVFDTQIAAGFAGYNSAGLATLVTALLDRRLDKGETMSDWLRRPLTSEQIAYAEADVAHLLELRGVLEGRLASLGRLPWALEECERLRRPRISDDATAWWRLKGSGRLTVSARGPAQELAAWRERAARKADRPANFIIPDEIVVALAERPPRSPADIPGSRRFDPRKLPNASLKDIVGAAARGAELTPEAIRQPPDRLPSHLEGLAALIAAWVAQQARDLSMDPALLATRRDVEAFLEDKGDCRLRDGWRAELVGDGVERIVAGRAAVAFDGRGTLVLVDR